MAPGASRAGSVPCRAASRTGHTSAAVTSPSTADSANSARKPTVRMIHSPNSGATAVDTKPDTP